MYLPILYIKSVNFLKSILFGRCSRPIQKLKFLKLKYKSYKLIHLIKHSTNDYNLSLNNYEYVQCLK